MSDSMTIERPVAQRARPRFEPLDDLRGLAVAGMILVDSPGSWGHVYTQLDHAAWHGWTLADLVFPTFLFSVGFAFALSFPRLVRPRDWQRIARRTVLLILLGLALNLLPWFDVAHWRIPGILQRIAMCYAAAATLTLLSARRDADGRATIRWPWLAGAAIALLVIYWLLLMLVPVPGFGAGRLDSDGSLPAWLDRTVFTVNHLWSLGTTPGVGVTYDPEGLLSTLPAIANVLVGIVAATLVRDLPQRRRIGWLALAGVAMTVVGLLLDPLVSINKRLWTPSFVILSSGIALAALAAIEPLAGGRPGRLMLAPLRILGGNAILAFILSQLLGIFSELPLFPPPYRTAQGLGFAIAQRIVPLPNLASLACAVAILAVITLGLAALHRRQVYFRL